MAESGGRSPHPGPLPQGEGEAVWLLTADAVRARAHEILALVESGGSAHFTYRAERLAPTVDYVLATIRANYPDLVIPFHSRWRHFTVGGVDRWGALAQDLAGETRAEITRIRFDLAVTSVLLDAGAGPAWHYREAGGGRYARSEGLGVASFHLFRDGVFSADENRPLRADAASLRQLDDAALASGMQVTAENPLVGVADRAALLRRLGAALAAQPALFGAAGRIGNLFDHLARQAVDGRLPATAILAALLRGFGTIWPGRHSLAGVALGDTWRHATGLVPFHKLSQWLAYSLIEPLEAAGIAVTEIDGLTGLAEYRNGGLFLDLDVIVPRDSALALRTLAVEDEAVVEWRALTVALLDRVAAGVRASLGVDSQTLPLAKVLEGGTWAAGRRIAAEKRPGGPPPLVIASDGTVF
ncbi:MAG TPA: URC4/urg3 family protein [Stellaceae bacterium]|jgi:hypothetical protein|nr:URC4/urg3 family protein [Stellaceae bacterium]